MTTNINKKHNLLHVVGTLGMGGAEMMLLHYTKALGNEHFHHYVYCFGVDGPIRPLLENLGVAVVFGPRVQSIKNPIKFASSLLSLFKNLLKFIREKGFVTIQSHSAQSDKIAVVVGKLAGVPAFPTIHSTMSILSKRNKLDPRVYINKVVDLIVYRVAERVIAVSDEVKDKVCNRYGLNESRVVVVKNGIFPNDLPQKNKNLSNKGIKYKKNIKILAVGRLAFEKKFDVLIKAASANLEKGHEEIFVQIVGDGEEYDHLLALINDLRVEPHVELLGRRNDVLELMQEADLFVMTSLYEGLSIAMIEAFSCGLPVIASNAPGLRDCIIHNENGMLFPVGDHVALAECILKIVGDRNLQIHLSGGALDSFKKNYNMQTNIKPLSQLIDKYKKTV